MVYIETDNAEIKTKNIIYLGNKIPIKLIIPRILNNLPPIL